MVNSTRQKIDSGSLTKMSNTPTPDPSKSANKNNDGSKAGGSFSPQRQENRRGRKRSAGTTDEKDSRNGPEAMNMPSTSAMALAGPIAGPSSAMLKRLAQNGVHIEQLGARRRTTQPCSSKIITVSISKATGASSSRRMTAFSSFCARDARNKAEKHRRDRINDKIAEIASLLPVIQRSPKKVDKVAVLRIAVNHIKCYKILSLHAGGEERLALDWPEMPELEEFLTNVEGLFVILSGAGHVMHVPRMVEDVLGFAQVDLLGERIFHFVHPDDILSVLRALQPTPGGQGKKEHREVYCRMRERISFREERYMYMHLSGYLQHYMDLPTNRVSEEQQSASGEAAEADGPRERTPRLPLEHLEEYVFIGFAVPVPSPLGTELSLFAATKDEYFTRHCLDGRIISVDQRISTIAGYMVKEVLGHSGFAYLLDQDKAMAAILHHNSKAFSPFDAVLYSSHDGTAVVTYRLRNKSNSYIFLKTKGFLEFSRNGGTCESFICINTLLSEEQGMIELRKQVKAYKFSDLPWIGTRPLAPPPTPIAPSGIPPAVQKPEFPTAMLSGLPMYPTVPPFAPAPVYGEPSSSMGSAEAVSHLSVGPTLAGQPAASFEDEPKLPVPLEVPLRCRNVSGPPAIAVQVLDRSLSIPCCGTASRARSTSVPPTPLGFGAASSSAANGQASGVSDTDEVFKHPSCIQLRKDTHKIKTPGNGLGAFSPGGFSPSDRKPFDPREFYQQAAASQGAQLAGNSRVAFPGGHGSVDFPRNSTIGSSSHWLQGRTMKQEVPPVDYFDSPPIGQDGEQLMDLLNDCFQFSEYGGYGSITAAETLSGGNHGPQGSPSTEQAGASASSVGATSLNPAMLSAASFPQGSLFSEQSQRLNHQQTLEHNPQEAAQRMREPPGMPQGATSSLYCVSTGQATVSWFPAQMINANLNPFNRFPVNSCTSSPAARLELIAQEAATQQRQTMRGTPFNFLSGGAQQSQVHFDQKGAFATSENHLHHQGYNQFQPPIRGQAMYKASETGHGNVYIHGHQQLMREPPPYVGIHQLEAAADISAAAGTAEEPGALTSISDLCQSVTPLEASFSPGEWQQMLSDVTRTGNQPEGDGLPGSFLQYSDGDDSPAQSSGSSHYESDPLSEPPPLTSPSEANGYFYGWQMSS